MIDEKPSHGIRCAICTEAALPLLVKHCADDGEDHAQHWQEQQAGEGLYLLAWRGAEPVGHLYIRWAGSHEIPRIRHWSPIAADLGPCPNIMGVWVVPNLRSRGIGTVLLREAEDLIWQGGYTKACLEVNADNPRARALYERLGYSDPGIGVFTTSGTFTDAEGHELAWQNGPQALLIKQSVGCANRPRVAHGIL